MFYLVAFTFVWDKTSTFLEGICSASATKNVHDRAYAVVIHITNHIERGENGQRVVIALLHILFPAIYRCR